MAKTASNMLKLGSRAVDFNLKEPLTKDSYTLKSFENSPVLVVAFICNHCPYVIHIADKMATCLNSWVDKGVGVVAVNSNDVESYPADSPDKMKEFAARHRFEFPYVFDETQEVAKAYEAACTPDFYVYDRDRKLVYRGQFDASRPGSNHEVTGEDLDAAIGATFEGTPVGKEQYPSIGCNIKWRE